MSATAISLSSSFSSAINRRLACFPWFSSSYRHCKTLKLSPYLDKKWPSNFACFSSSSMENSAVGGAIDGAVAPKPKPWLIVGLGNPGKLYNGTRHNVGFEMIDAIAEAEGISMSSVSFRALFGKGSIGNAAVILAKPQTFMNASGESVAQIVSYYKIPLNQVLVIFDDMDLAFARLKLLPKGGHGGHNGMRSIIDRLKGSRDFPRLRIGIGRPPGKLDAANFVLRPFSRQERQEAWRQCAFFCLKELIRAQPL